jgi:hypothetical protein
MNAMRDTFEDHVADALELPLELLVPEGSDIFETVDCELLDIPFPEMQDRLFDFFVEVEFNSFNVGDGNVLSRLVEQQLRRRSASEVASRLSASQCFTRASIFEPGHALKHTLRNVYSNVSQAQRNESVYAVLVCKGSNGVYRANVGISVGGVFMMRQLFRCGASPLARDAAGVLLVANLRCSSLPRVGGLVRFGGESLAITDPRIVQEVMWVLEKFTPARWTVDSHHLFPDDFRARVRELLLCNQRLRTTGAACLSMDPLEIVIQWLAVGEVLGEDAIENEVAKLLLRGEDDDDGDD